MKFLGIINWVISALAIGITAYLLEGVEVTPLGAVIAALVIGFFNAFVKPILLIFTLPINILSLGLFTFILNAFLILLASRLVPDFSVDSFWWALLFSLILSVVSFILHKILGNGKYKPG